VEPSWVETGTFVTLVASLVVLGIYTHQTWRLRQVAEEQVRTGYKPIVTLDFGGEFGEEFQDQYGSQHEGFPAVILRNVGLGPAFNVVLQHWQNGDCRIEFDNLPLLLPDQKLNLRPRVFMESASIDDNPLRFAAFVGRNDEGLNRPLNIDCRIVPGRRWRASLHQATGLV